MEPITKSQFKRFGIAEKVAYHLPSFSFCLLMISFGIKSPCQINVLNELKTGPFVWLVTMNTIPYQAMPSLFSRFLFCIYFCSIFFLSSLRSRNCLALRIVSLQFYSYVSRRHWHVSLLLRPLFSHVINFIFIFPIYSVCFIFIYFFCVLDLSFFAFRFLRSFAGSSWHSVPATAITISKATMHKKATERKKKQLR